MLIPRINGLIIKIYNLLIGLRFINLNNKICRRIRSVLFHNICYGCYASFGKENPERKFYLIRCSQAEMGLFAVINYVIFHLDYADKEGLEPVVDWQYYPNKYFSDDNKVGKKNPWEDLFYQTTKIELAELYRSKNVYMSSGSWEIPYDEIYDEDRLNHSHQIWIKYLKLSDKTKELFDEEYKRMNFNNNRILGVKCRGTDFVLTKPSGHQIVPTVDMTIQTIEEKISEWGEFDKIFISTEDEYILSQMKEYFQEKLVFVNARRLSLKQNEWLCEMYDRFGDEDTTKEIDMRNYLVETYLLASCDSLIAPEIGGTIGAMRISEKFSNIFIFKLGHYE